MTEVFMHYQHIKYKVEDHIGTITLNRPEKLNAFTPTMREELISAFGRADEDDEVRVIIVTGTGRAFCAGADLSKGGDTFHFDDSFRDGGGQVSLKIFRTRNRSSARSTGLASGSASL
jgi:enoyl-CoA hydratase/carnithine racemase